MGTLDVIAQKQIDTERYILSTMPRLYLPLWKRDGSSFISEDGAGTTCTVTGAIWTPQGRSLDKTDDIISVPDSTALSIIGDLTVDIWYKTNGATGGSTGLIWAHDTGGQFGEYSILLLSETRPYVYHGAAVVGIDGDGMVTADVWQHLTITRAHTVDKKYRLYTNGILKGTGAAYATDPAAVAKPFILGKYTTTFFGGWIGEIAIYNRTFSPLEVKYSHQMTKWRYL